MSGMKIVHITAGAGGRICGSCLHDNALVRALRARGGDAILVPAYVPTTTDEENIAERKVVMGGVNVWLQQNVPLFRHTPTFVDRPLDSRGLLDWLSSRTGGARAADLGPLTVSSLEGELGHQRKEVAKLAAWLASDVRPDVVHLSNVLLLGLARSIRAATGAAIVCSLSGEDVFIDAIPEPHRGRLGDLLREQFFQWPAPAGGAVSLSLFDKVVETAGSGIGLDLPIPLVIDRRMQHRHEVSVFTGR